MYILRKRAEKVLQFLLFMTTFHDFALKIETGNVKIKWNMFKMQRDNHNFRKMLQQTKSIF